MTDTDPKTAIHHPPLTRDNDLSKTAASEKAVLDMVLALQDSSNDMHDHFHDGFRWLGNTGCGTKEGLAQFRRNWQLPLRAAFSNRTYHEQARVTQGEWVSAFGYIEATHSGEFMGVAPTGKIVQIRYTDFWKVSDGKIEDNWVTVDFPFVLAQLGVDVFNGTGWEGYDSGLATPASPDNEQEKKQ